MAQLPPRGNTPKTKLGQKIAIGFAIVLVGLTMCSCFGVSTLTSFAKIFPVTVTPVAQATHTTSVAQVATTTPTPTSQVVQITPTATPKPTVAPTATPVPTQAPAPTAVPTQAPIPTQPPAPTQPPPQPTQPPPTGVNGNPWGYNFTPGNTIAYPPDGFCNYFNCIASFYEADDPGDGYVVECSDGTYSQSGGERGACSRHGGVFRALYSH